MKCLRLRERGFPCHMQSGKNYTIDDWQNRQLAFFDREIESQKTHSDSCQDGVSLPGSSTSKRSLAKSHSIRMEFSGICSATKSSTKPLLCYTYLLQLSGSSFPLQEKQFSMSQHPRRPDQPPLPDRSPNRQHHFSPKAQTEPVPEPPPPAAE